MKQINIAHIHTDFKFVNNTSQFENEKFNNIIILLCEKGKYKGKYEKYALYFKQKKRKDLKKIINLCEKVDIVVLYDLTLIKSYIVNRLPSSIKVIWRFFGYELYGKMPQSVYSKMSLELINQYNQENLLINLLKKIDKRIKQQIKWQTNLNKEFFKSINRINYFWGLSEFEYNFLKQYWPNLPPFIQHSFSKYNNKKIEAITNRTNEIIIGNNRSAYNNHLDILKLIETNNNKDNYIFYLLFNYGQNNIYAKKVREEATKIQSLKIIEDFMPLEEFERLYLSISALVINGYRQMAMGNIFQALRNGTKVYLNKKNIMLDWLKHEGFLVFTIEEFIRDMDTNNISLSIEESKINELQFQKFVNKYNIEDFQKNIFSLIAKNN